MAAAARKVGRDVGDARGKLACCWSRETISFLAVPARARLRAGMRHCLRNDLGNLGNLGCSGISVVHRDFSFHVHDAFTPALYVPGRLHGFYLEH